MKSFKETMKELGYSFAHKYEENNHNKIVYEKDSEQAMCVLMFDINKKRLSAGVVPHHILADEEQVKELVSIYLELKKEVQMLADKSGYEIFNFS